MNKKILLSLLLFSSGLISIFAEKSPVEFNIKLNTIVTPSDYTISLKYNDNEYEDPIRDVSFSDSFSSSFFTVELSKGNKKRDLQFTIKIIPGSFIKQINNIEEEPFDTLFKPKPTLDETFKVDSVKYNRDSKIMEIKSKIIPAGMNNVPQALAKFNLGWSDTDKLPIVSNGTYISTTTIEYTSEEITEAL